MRHLSPYYADAALQRNGDPGAGEIVTGLGNFLMFNVP